MKKNVLYPVILVLALSLYSSAFAQMNYWTTPCYKFDMNPATPVRSMLPGPASAFPTYNVANGAYDQNGNLLFYVRNNLVFGPSSIIPIGKLGGWNLSNCLYALNSISTEVAIVPIPGACKQFYIIYGMNSLIDGYILLYCKVDCSGTTPVVVNWRNVQVNCPPEPLKIEPEGFLISGTTGTYFQTGLAVSKIYTGTGLTAKRYLFTTSPWGIYRSIISSSGITNALEIASAYELGLTGTDNFEGCEAELSWGLNKFAWADNYPGQGNQVHVIGINALGQWDGNIQNYSISGPRGIEFNNSITNPLLYVSGASGITKINTQTQTKTSVTLSAGIDLSNTMLEYGKNNNIYGISPTYDIEGTLTATTLIGISSTDGITTLNAGFDSRSLQGGDKIFTLPDQIDGDDYNQFNGYPIVSLTGFTLNSLIPSSFCNSATNYFNCSTITFNPIYNGGNPTKYKFEIKATDANCNLITGSGYINYNPGGLIWTTGQPPADLDLRTLTDGAGLNLGNITGKVNIKYSILDACNNLSTKNYTIMVSSAPQAGIVLEIYNKANSQVYLSPSHSITSPVGVGTITLGFRVSNSTGLITYYTVKIEEVNSINGEVLQKIYEVTKNIAGASGLTLENLNSECINATVWPSPPGFGNCTNNTPAYNGYTGYFAKGDGQYSYLHYYKLTVTIGNPCNKSSDYSFLYVNSIGNKSGLTTGDIISENDLVEKSLSVYPNPASKMVTFVINNSIDEHYSLTISDMYGREVKHLMSNQLIQAGLQTRDFNIADLPTGIYTYLLVSPSFTRKGLLSKQ